MCSFYFSNQYLGNFDAVNKFLHPRGPDKTNMVNFDGFTFIHNLLSLTGQFRIQPYIKNNLFLLFNGEIYNYKNFDDKAECDTDVIIPLYEKYGEDFIKKLDGEFAILLLDLNKKIVLFSTDTFRTKPLFFSIQNKKICVSTYSTPIKESGFANVQKAEANTLYVYNIENEKLTKKINTNFNLDQNIDNINGWIKKFDKSIEKRTKYSLDKKFFIGLSSGYDSGLISCVLNKNSNIDYKAYSIAASENLSILKERLNLIKNKELIFLKKESYEYFSKNLFGTKTEDFVSSDFGSRISSDKASFGLAYICSLAQQEGRKIYISGQGADEIISDYGMHGNKIYSHSSFGGNFPNDLKTVFPWRSFFGGTQELYLSKEEYVAGSFGIETRYPFLDVELVQEYLNLSNTLKNKEYKYVIKEYLTANGYPFENNKKIGFQANVNLC